LITDDDPTIGGGNNFPLILGAVGGLLLLLLFGALFKRKKEHVEHASSSSLDAGIGIVPANDSFIAADSKNLGMHASGMDVHECKSAFCPKCYIDRNIMFLAAPPTPRPPTAQEEAAENGWNAPTNSSLGSSSYESSSTTEFAS
jgi:LPXTG-motif cell wall-anchored protein